MNTFHILQVKEKLQIKCLLVKEVVTKLRISKFVVNFVFDQCTLYYKTKYESSLNMLKLFTLKKKKIKNQDVL